jgi:uncharacterized protein (DUF885 family)
MKKTPPRSMTSLCILLLVTLFQCGGSKLFAAAPNETPLVAFFQQWRQFELPTMNGNVPDYTPEAMTAKAAALPQWRDRLEALDRTGWSLQQQDDSKLIQAEMNGLDFSLRVLRPWARDPSFYSYPEIQLYNYRFPLSSADQRGLATKIAMIPVFLAQAKQNLKDSNARDLWVYGAKELQNQARALASLEAGTLTVSTLEGSQHASLTGATPELRAAVSNARRATDDFIAWLIQLAPSKTGPSGIGKENYTWYQQNVHFVPYTWDEEVVLLHRELERAQAALREEEHNNRNLPPLEPAADVAAFDKLSHERLDKFVAFLVQQEIIPDKPYLKSALELQLGSFVPPDQRVFFTRITHREPMLLLSHDYHWIDLARMRDEPNSDPIRRFPSLSNIWDTRAEGFATAFEELMMRVGLYDNNPRARELVWIMLANRAARGLASLYVQANLFTLEQAGKFQAEWTPRGWAVANDQLTGFEQLLYLRQPGYGTSYITGKLLFDRLLTEYGHQQDLAGKPFVLREFMDRFNGEGMIPVPLMEAEMISQQAREP